MTSKYKMILALFITALLILITIKHEVVSFHVSQPGYYKGTVINKVTSIGRRSSTYFLYIDWDVGVKQRISVHTTTYGNYNTGDRYSTQFNYLPVFGAAGAAYVPNTGEYPFWLAIAGVLSKLILIIGLIYAICCIILHYKMEKLKR